MAVFDAHKNFAITTVATAPTPAISGGTLTVQDATVFPATPFNATVWPLDTNAISTNSEVVRVTNIASNTLTITRAQEGSSARTILVTDQIAATVTAKTVTDIEGPISGGTAGQFYTSNGAGLIGSFQTFSQSNTNNICDGRLTLTTVTPVTTGNVTAATSVFFTPYSGKYISLYNGSTWDLLGFSELTLSVPATTSTVYDVFAFNNSGVAAVEALAWTNDTTRATALVKQDGVLAKTGALTRRYLGSFRTTTVSGQTEDSATKRHLWNYYNRVKRPLQRFETTASWNYMTATVRQANGSTANQVDILVGFQEALLDLELMGVIVDNGGNIPVSAGIGESSTTTYTVGSMVTTIAEAGTSIPTIRLAKYPAVGRNFYSWNEWSTATGTTVWHANVAAVGSSITAGLAGFIEG